MKIEPLSLNSLMHYEDCVKVKLQSTKSDQVGEKCRLKHVYGNIFNPEIFFFTAIGTCLCLNAFAFENNGNIFQSTNDDNTRNASKRCCTQAS